MKPVLTEGQFLSDVAKHEMIVIKDDGVHRHIRFKRPGTGCMHFDLITWPGYLCYTGDMGTYVFCRLHDMFEFFRTDREYAQRKGRKLSINLGYWAEKIEASDKHDGVTEFDEERFRRVVNDHRLRWARDMKEAGLDKDARRDMWEEVENDVLVRADDGEHAANYAVYEFSYRAGGLTFTFDDFFEHSFKRPTHRFIWCCYALAWGIERYDAAQSQAKVAA